MTAVKATGIHMRFRHESIDLRSNDEIAQDKPARNIWCCGCGSTLFELHPHDAVCSKCFNAVRGWAEII